MTNEDIEEWRAAFSKGGWKGNELAQLNALCDLAQRGLDYAALEKRCEEAELAARFNGERVAQIERTISNLTSSLLSAESSLAAAQKVVDEMVPRSRYDACNQDWLNALAEIERIRKVAKEEIERLNRALKEHP